MWKVLIFWLFVQILNAENLQCSINKLKNKCLCKSLTNQYTKLPVSVADCTGLGTENFPNIAALSEDLNVLDLSLNDIQSLDLTQNINVDTSSLIELIARHNRINFIDDKFFESFENLLHLDLSYNNITDIANADLFRKLKKLHYLDISFNNIKTLPSGIFESLQIITHLDIGNNPLGLFMTQSTDVLSRILGISENVTHLGLNNLGLNDVNADYFGYLKQLKSLDIADNNFQYIPTVPYSVEHLDLSGNNFTYISARYLNYHSLKYLRISRMSSLVSIHHYAFYNLQAIEKLVITDCPKLIEFTELAFGLPAKTTQAFPKHLSLARNGLRSLNSTYKHLFRKMDHIDLRENPWNCDCDLLWLQEFETELFGSKDVRCASPAYLKTKRVMEIKQFDLQHCFPEIYGKTSHRVLIIILTSSVIFLLGFIFYLVKYPNTWLNPKKYAVVGPNSPYNPAPVIGEER